MRLTLYSYFRSTAAYRVRIALNLKGVPYTILPVHLVREGGEHRGAAYRTINPQMRVPALRVEREGAAPVVLLQSPAILEWIEETFPEPALLPGDAEARARARAIAAIIGCDIHPLNNMGVLNYLRGPLAQTQAALDAWYAHWIHEGFQAIEALLAPDGEGPYALGPVPTLADVFVTGQVFNARRFAVPIEAYPRIRRAEAALRALPAVAAAAPEHHPDAE